MKEQIAVLEKAHIKNFLSLHNLSMPLKPLTILVGPNASGKSNIFRALSLFTRMLKAERLPRDDIIQNFIWAGGSSSLTFQFQTKVNTTPTLYQIKINMQNGDFSLCEDLLINEVKVISIQDGKGEVWDENGKTKIHYNAKPNKISLGSAGDYGEKPITNKVTEFFKEWEFYDLKPELMRGYFQTPPIGFDPDTLMEMSIEYGKFTQLSNDGSNLLPLLSSWYNRRPKLFKRINELLFASTKLKIDYNRNNEHPQLYVLEGYKHPIPFNRASEGTLNLLAYYTLVNQPTLPTFVGIEEPERHLHPGALPDVTKVLEHLAKRTQVIITTHSSQLLDAFNPNDLSDFLGILLLRNRSGLGTEVLNLEEILDNREALDGWIADFGIGSAIFDSELLQDLMEEPV